MCVGGGGGEGSYKFERGVGGGALEVVVNLQM